MKVLVMATLVLGAFAAMVVHRDPTVLVEAQALIRSL